ncbi:hypothetical protein FGO68_gene4456 [Halteria grandinella]|uniref:Uncharacterized protein n=1 Tax=Halteria grandinella TaxID=5974 RepID=A0A8J8T0T9_HALGN|nr:hypothetical protein FGO68_gene4456 [Halteria grandinella]
MSLRDILALPVFSRATNSILSVKSLNERVEQIPKSIPEQYEFNFEGDNNHILKIKEKQNGNTLSIIILSMKR